MEVKTFLRLRVVVLLLAGLNGARAEEKYFTQGGKMVLEPKVTTTIVNILWKHKGNLLAEWIKDTLDLTYYDTFNGRTTLDITTGRLEITKVTKDDAGAYTLEINSKVHGESYTAKVIKAVPDPSVWIQPVACTRESPSCTLLCEGRTPEGAPEDTREAEPITYSWKQDEKEWSISGKNISIDKETAGTKTFFCRMQNPVSTKESQSRDNPFYVRPTTTTTSNLGGIIGGVVGVLALLALVGVGYFKRDAIKDKIFPGAASDDPDANGMDYVNVPVNESPKTDDENVPLKESPKTDDVNVPVHESPKTDDENVPLKESPKTDDVTVPVNGSPNTDYVNVPVNESPKTDDVNVPVNESPKTDDVTATELKSH